MVEMGDKTLDDLGHLSADNRSTLGHLSYQSRPRRGNLPFCFSKWQISLGQSRVPPKRHNNDKCITGRIMLLMIQKSKFLCKKANVKNYKGSRQFLHVCKSPLITMGIYLESQEFHADILHAIPPATVFRMSVPSLKGNSLSRRV